MKSTISHSAGLNACFEELKDFSPGQPLPVTPQKTYAGYFLNGPQVGAVKLLLHIVNRLDDEKQQLQRRLRETEADINEVQKVVDMSIAYL
jgi:hypothetical protein